MIVSSRIATAVAFGAAGSIVRTSPPHSTIVAGPPTFVGPGSRRDEPLHAHASALVSKTDRQIDLHVTGFETIPKIQAQKWQHDLS